MPCLIIEGPDGAGKTTLIEALRKEWRWSGVDHHGAYLGETAIAQHYMGSLYRAYKRLQRLQVLDRSWLAEPIYGTVMRSGATRIASYERRMLERAALGVGAVTVVCLPPFRACERAWKNRIDREYPRKVEQLAQIYEGYGKLRDELGGRAAIHYDYVNHSFGGFVDQVKAMFPYYENYGSGIGSWRAKTLLIGDRPHNPSVGYPAFPFVSLKRTGCSAWLTEQLEAWGVSESDLYWINQATVEPGDAYLERFERVIALGGNAVDWCERAGVDHRAAPHPQFWKRFHHTDPYPLKELLT